MAQVNLDIADKSTLDEVNSKIGVTTDSDGSSSAGSILAKLNKIISDLSKNSSIDTLPVETDFYLQVASTEASTNLEIVTLSNVLIYGVYGLAHATSSNNAAIVIKTDDTTQTYNNTTGSDKWFNIERTLTTESGWAINSVSNSSEADTGFMSCPIYAEYFSISVNTSTLVSDNSAITVYFAYKQL